MLDTAFTPEKVEVLSETLTRHIDQMDIAIDRIETHDFKMKLRRRRERLESLLQKLSTVSRSPNRSV